MRTHKAFIWNHQGLKEIFQDIQGQNHDGKHWAHYFGEASPRNHADPHGIKANIQVLGIYKMLKDVKQFDNILAHGVDSKNVTKVKFGGYETVSSKIP